MHLYAAKNHDRYYDRLFMPERITGRVMINPHYGITQLWPEAKVLIDSGSFQDNGIKRPRVAPDRAFNRQLALESRLQQCMPSGWHAEGIVSYDQMFGVDERVVEIEVDGVRTQRQIKERGTEESATPAIVATLEAAAYYASQRHRVQGHILFAAQGINPRQYLNDCVVPMLSMMQADDWLAFGGFCIIGKIPSLKPVFYETLEMVIPVAKRKGIRRFHILGVTVTDAISIAYGIARREGVVISTDSSSIEVNSTYGKIVNPLTGRMQKVYGKDEKGVAYHPCNLAHHNLRAYRDWLNHLRGGTSPATERIMNAYLDCIAVRESILQFLT